MAGAGDAALPSCILTVDCRERAVVEAIARRCARNTSGYLFATDSDGGDGAADSGGGDVGDVAADHPPDWLSVARMDVGDATVGGALLVERKTLADLAASIKDGRYREQKARLLAERVRTGAAVAYVIEGAFTFGTEGELASERHGLAPSALRTAVLTTLLRDRVPVVLTRDVDDTAAFLCAARERVAATQGPAPPGRYEDAACAAAVRSKKRDNLDVALCYKMQLCQVPGVSPKVADEVRKLYQTLTVLFAALQPLAHMQRVKRLMELPRIGQRTAISISEFMFSAAAAVPAPA